MKRVEDIESMFPWLGSNLRALNERAATLKKCQAMRTLRRTKEFLQSHTVNSLLLVILVVLGFLPFIAFAIFVSSSFLVVSLSAITLFAGTFAVAFFSFLVVTFPFLMFGAALAIIVYLAYRLVVNTLHMIKQFRDMILALPSRILPECFRFGNFKVQSQLVLIPQNEEMVERNPLNGVRGIKSRNYSFNKMKLD